MWKVVRTLIPIEVLQRAKRYTDLLAKGIDPISEEEVEEGNFIKQERLSTYFTYVSWVLDDVIKNGGKVYKQSRYKDFMITQAQISTISITSTPISMFDFCERIYYAASDPKMKKLEPAKLNIWLERSGYLCFDRDSREEFQQSPSEMGRNLGITSQQRYEYRQVISVNFYDATAQQHILDNMGAILGREFVPWRDDESYGGSVGRRSE